jgi:rubredoxin
MTGNEEPMEGVNVEKYICSVCGYIYDPEKGDRRGEIEPGTLFSDLPADWRCPVCGAGKKSFRRY